MHRIIYILLLLQIAFYSISRAGGSPVAPLINNLDTVVFDLSQAVCSSGTMDFPLFIISDEPVYAIDFSLKFNPGDLTYLTTNNLKPYLDTSVWFNASDSTLRFSSFSMQPIDVNTPLVRLSFNLPSAQINLARFDSVFTLLNGDNCSNRFIDPVLPVSIGISGAPTIELGDSLLLSVDFVPGVNYLWSTGETSTSIYVSAPGTYTVTVASLMGCNSLAAIDIGYVSPLPIELIVFEGEQQADGIKLVWMTASELNNDFFELQHLDVEENWQVLHRFEGAGNSNNNNQYSYIDKNPDFGINYYRLKQVDFDGTISFSFIRKVDYIDNTEKQLVRAFPNPSKSGNEIQFEIPFEFGKLKTRMIITDQSGKIVLDRYVDVPNATSGKWITSVVLPISCQSGLYSTTFITDGNSAACRFILQ